MAEARTDAQGNYRFDGLLPGTYRVTEVTPDGLIDGADRVGTVDGRPMGQLTGDDTIGGITLTSGQTAIDYDFCEHAPASLSGTVYHDRNNNGRVDPGEEPLAGVAVRLLDDAQQVVATTQTDRDGRYAFGGLRSGQYSVAESQPAGYLDGTDAAGTVGDVTVGTAVNPGDQIRDIRLRWGDAGRHYDFGELLPGSIAGTVHADLDRDCRLDAEEQPLAGVTIELLDASGRVVTAAQTDGQGRYRFDGLAPGTYSVRERQPAGYFQGGQRAGSGGGDASLEDVISAIAVGSGQPLTGYDFCEVPPSSLTGRVHLDPNQNRRFDDGEQALAGVAVRLLDSAGRLVAATTTDVAGRYRFDSLPPGQYVVQEIQPREYFQGYQRAGSHGGNAAVDDVISEIAVPAGQALTDYDFGELPPSSLTGRVHLDPNQNCRFDDGEQALAGVTIRLLDSAGRLVASTTTDAAGRYRFDSLPPGQYAVQEVQPREYYQGCQRAGSHGGNAAVDDVISGIEIPAGQALTDYDFSELPPSSLTGRVHLDPNQNCRFDDGEQALAGVTIRLLDSAGRLVATTTTDAAGRYRFDSLRPGQYAVQEIQPREYYQGCQRAGSHGGNATVDDVISGIEIPAGQALTDYDFSELPPSSLTGRVHLDPNQNCRFDDGEQALAGVSIRLLDSGGRIVATATTDGAGRYRFDPLPPGQYAVEETQPDQYFQGGQRAGSHGGNVAVDNVISHIQILAGQALTDYDFCELPPAQLSGYVFQDGGMVRTLDGRLPADIWQQRDGRRTPDDRRLGGVVLELRDARTGQPVTGQQALPGTYGSGAITAVTDAEGYYEFRGLPPGVYDVIQVQPAGLSDGLDTPGTTGGVAFNPSAAIDSRLRDVRGNYPQYDAIVSIPLGPGIASEENNFSEIALGRMIIGLPPDAPRSLPPPPAPVQIAVPPLAPPPIIVPAPYVPVRYETYGAGGLQNFSWHLSVIDAGAPRGQGDRVPLAGLVWRSATFRDVEDWYGQPLDRGRWILGRENPDDRRAASAREAVFGLPDGIPVTGDFNGDGVDEIAIFRRGHFYLDLNGNGRWDDEDLWARLGDEFDLPVTGDWNGDGKDDIGIFGPAWPGDPQALAIETGLPDLRNQVLPLPKPKNVPPKPQEATSGLRLLRHTATGTTRADVIDHVFLYGAGVQIPVTGDWSGDGIKNIGVFRDGRWRLDADGDGRWSKGDRVFEYGAAGDLPVVGDFDGDGTDEIAVFRGGQWIVDLDGNHEMDAHDAVFSLGSPGDLPVAGDWNGDGTDEPGIYRPESTEARQDAG